MIYISQTAVYLFFFFKKPVLVWGFFYFNFILMKSNVFNFILMNMFQICFILFLDFLVWSIEIVIYNKTGIMLSWTGPCVFPGYLWICTTLCKYNFNCEHLKGTNNSNVPTKPRTPSRAWVMLQQHQSPAPQSPALPGHGLRPSLALAYPRLLTLIPPGLPCSLAGIVG